MTAKGTIPSKPAYRKPKGWNLTHLQKMRIAADLKKFCEEPFPNGATIIEWNGVEGGLKP
jgi:hypothetical protein